MKFYFHCRTIDDFFENEEDPIVIPSSDKEWDDYFGFDHYEDGYIDVDGHWYDINEVDDE